MTAQLGEGSEPLTRNRPARVGALLPPFGGRLHLLLMFSQKVGRDSLRQRIGPFFVFRSIAGQVLLGEDESVVDIVVRYFHVVLLGHFGVRWQVRLEAHLQSLETEAHVSGGNDPRLTAKYADRFAILIDPLADRPDLNLFILVELRPGLPDVVR